MHQARPGFFLPKLFSTLMPTLFPAFKAVKQARWNLPPTHLNLRSGKQSSNEKNRGESGGKLPGAPKWEKAKAGKKEMNRFLFP